MMLLEGSPPIRRSWLSSMIIPRVILAPSRLTGVQQGPGRFSRSGSDGDRAGLLL
jgi:hypothetical protein